MKGANVMPTRTFDARPDRLDLRDLPYRAPLRSLPPRYPLDRDVQKFIPSYVAEHLVLDQGSEGACTGFGLACVANYLFWVRHVEQGTETPFLPVSPRMLYELAKRYDEWPGTDYEGSSCRGALKGWNKHGVCSAECWPYRLDKDGKPVFVSPSDNWQRDAAQRPLGVYYRVARESIVDLQAAISDIGAVYVSGSAHDGWDALANSKTPAPNRHDDLPDIQPMKDAKSAGGHSFALVGYNERGFVVQNSWGTAWGASGFAVLPYDDWIVNATDAWACALGVPAVVRDAEGASTRPVTASRWRVVSGGSLTSLDRQSRTAGNPADDPWPIDHPFNYKPYEPWSTAAAYEHTLVTGNNGELVQTDFTMDPAARGQLAKQIVVDAPLMWLAGTGGKVLKLALYAHGGLNDEASSIRRIRVLGPCFEANGVYPLFLTWKTGVGETLNDMAEDWARRSLGEEAARSKGILDALGDAKDRALEAAAHVLFKGVWTEMRDNAAASVQEGRGLDLLARNLLALQQELAAAGKQLELHLAGHSAGSILLGHLLTRLGNSQPGGSRIAVKTSTLWAAACSSSFANEHYLPAQQSGLLDLSNLHLYVLSDENEEADALPSPQAPIYGKSLLYLVSRALDDTRKMPLLGMQRAEVESYEHDDHQWDGGELPAIQRWQSIWRGQAKGLLHVVQAPHVTVTREGAQMQATHVSFDNSIEVVSETIARIKGDALVRPLEWLDY
jgi:hypothetical protein